MLNVQQMMKRQRVLADFGEFALRSENLDEVLTEACRLVGEALGTARAKILEIQEHGRSLFVRAGVGWAPDIVGQLRMPMSERSSETFAINEGQPVISQDINKEERFVFPEFMREAGVIALANVPIRVPGGEAYGLLQVDATEPRDFGDEDTEFLRTYATILGPVIDRLRQVSALRATEERFRLGVENAHDHAIFTCDLEDRIVDWYTGAQTVFDWSAEEAVGQPAAIIFTPEDRAAGVDAVETAMAAREGSAPNVRWHVRQDGSRVYIEGMTTSLRAADGSLIGFLKIGQDVTARRRADEALRESEARLSLLVESWAQAVWETDADGVVIADSPSWRAYTGQNLQEWLGYGWLDAIHPDDRSYAERQWRDAIAARGLVNAEFRLRAPGGTWRWTNVRAAPVLDAAGNIGKWAGMNIDIDAQKRAEAAMRESEERLRQFGEASSDVLWIRDAQTLQWLYLTPAFERIYGLDREAALLDDNMAGWLDLILPEDREITLDSFEAVRAGERVSFEYRIRRPKDGTIRWLRDTDFPMRDAEGRVCWIGGVGRDVTEEKAAASRQEVLINELQHRARNLLGVITAVADRTVKQGGSVEAFEERLQALSRAQGLLSTGGSATVAVGALVRAELAAHVDELSEHIAVSGPDVLLSARQVQNFALAVHELTTNAVKYGALKIGVGQLSVKWEIISDRRGRRRLALDWIESGVDVRPAEVTRRGYGTELIQEALAYALDAAVDYSLGENGVRCRIVMPID